MSDVSDVSKNIINREEIIKWYSDTFSDTDILNEFNNKISDDTDTDDTFFKGMGGENIIGMVLAGYLLKKNLII